MKKSELEKAAREFCEISVLTWNNDYNTDYFIAGAKWALEWVLANIKCATVYQDASREYLTELLTVKDETETKEK